MLQRLYFAAANNNAAKVVNGFPQTCKMLGMLQSQEIDFSDPITERKKMEDNVSTTIPIY